MDESGCQSIPSDLLQKQTQQMDQLHHQHGVHSQLTCGTRTQCILILSHNGLQPLNYSTIVPPTNVFTVEEHLDNLWQAWQEAEAAHELAQQ